MKKWMAALLCLCLLLVLPLPAMAETDDQTGLNSQSEGGTGDQSSCEHSYGSWSDSGTTHSRTCSLCSKTDSVTHSYYEGTVTTAATCSAAGVKTFACTVCAATKTESIAATGTHVYQNGVKVDDTNHTLSCSGCSQTKTEAHSWQEDSVITAASCITDGKKLYKCSQCPAIREGTVAKTAHTLSAWTTTDTTHSRNCTVTGCTYVENGNHNWANETLITEATCKEVGAKSYTCSACSKTKYEEIALKTTHTYDNDCDAECNVCAATRDAEHKYSKEWSTNGSSHWHACAACGEKKDLRSHVPGPLATEDSPQICLSCGYIIVAKLNHVHAPSTAWSSDKNGHWHKCDGCEVELEYTKHDFGTGCDGCKICGYTDPATHIYDGVWEMDKMSHWAICTVCAKASELEDHIPGPEATEDKPQTCTKCGYVIAEFAEHTHTFTGELLSNSAEHWEVCECGEKGNPEPHIWDEGVENKEDTVTYTCLLCKETRTVDQVKKSGFPWGAVLAVLVILLVGTIGALAWMMLKPKKRGRFSK